MSDEYEQYKNLQNISFLYLSDLDTVKMNKFYAFLHRTLDFHVMMEFFSCYNTEEILSKWKKELPNIWDVFDEWLLARQQEYK